MAPLLGFLVAAGMGAVVLHRAARVLRAWRSRSAPSRAARSRASGEHGRRPDDNPADTDRQVWPW